MTPDDFRFEDETTPRIGWRSGYQPIEPFDMSPVRVDPYEMNESLIDYLYHGDLREDAHPHTLQEAAIVGISSPSFAAMRWERAYRHAIHRLRTNINVALSRDLIHEFLGIVETILPDNFEEGWR